MKARTQDKTATATVEAACCHHWVLGAPQDGEIRATCRKCDAERVYPAVLDDLDPRPDPDKEQHSGVATAVGGARPSSVADPSVKAKSRLPVGKQS
jgi:hypothetical protein